MKDDRLYLLYIRECIARIEAYTAEGSDAFFDDIKTQDAVLRNLHTLAESTQRLSEDLKQRHTHVDWQSISGFRNVLVHDYLGVSVRRIWEIVSIDIPALKLDIESMLREFGQ